MAKDERTEKATPRKRKETREKGNLPQSKEMALFINLICLTLFLSFFGTWFVKEILTLENASLGMVTANMDIFSYFRFLAQEMVNIIVPMAGLCLVFIFINYIFQVRFLFSLKVIQPNIQRINPKNFFMNLFSRRSLVQILKQIVLVSILGYIVYLVFFNHIQDIVVSVNKPWDESLILMWSIFKEVIYKLLLAMLIIGLIDFFYQRWEYEDSIKMKKEEIKRDRKDTDGDPEVKFRQNQRRIAFFKNNLHKKMKEEVTFMTTNPTHYAVAVYFRPGKGNPKVVIKGMDHYALLMKDVAKKYNVPIYEDPPLARELYNRVIENEEIPSDMWAAIALVIRKLMEQKELKF